MKEFNHVCQFNNTTEALSQAATGQLSSKTCIKSKDGIAVDHVATHDKVNERQHSRGSANLESIGRRHQERFACSIIAVSKYWVLWPLSIVIDSGQGIPRHSPVGVE
jgi:hypothetical protein